LGAMRQIAPFTCPIYERSVNMMSLRSKFAIVGIYTILLAGIDAIAFIGEGLTSSNWHYIAFGFPLGELIIFISLLLPFRVNKTDKFDHVMQKREQYHFAMLYGNLVWISHIVGYSVLWIVFDTFNYIYFAIPTIGLGFAVT